MSYDSVTDGKLQLLKFSITLDIWLVFIINRQEEDIDHIVLHI